MASANGHLEIVKLLLKHGAKPNSLNKSKNTPLRKDFNLLTLLDWAALNGRSEVIEYLIGNGANANLKNDFDHLPLEGALQNGFTEAAVSLS